jgi:hypothetical protein
MDDFYKGFSGLIGNLIDQNTPGVQKMMGVIRENHRKHYAATKAIGGKTMPELVLDYENKLREYRKQKGQRTVESNVPSSNGNGQAKQ